MIGVGILAVCLLSAPARAIQLRRAPSSSPQQVPYTARVNYTGFTTTTLQPYPFIFSQELFLGEGIGTAMVAPRKTDNRVTIEIEDLSGRQAAGWVYYIKPGEDIYSTLLMCPATKRPLKIDPQFAVLVGLAAGECSGEQSLPTRGVVEFVFSRAR